MSPRGAREYLPTDPLVVHNPVGLLEGPLRPSWSPLLTLPEASAAVFEGPKEAPMGGPRGPREGPGDVSRP
eukprot:5507073-Pyramimonas_sp.AAC.1